MKSFARSLASIVLILLVASPAAALAQEETAYSEAAIDQMLAPIALYPDVLLSQILMAATYPVEVVQASRWSRANPGVEGDAAVNAVAGEDWDPSVKALVAFPQVLARMDEDLDWTQRLGEAFVFQESEVMGRVQALRQRAYEAGNLQGLDHVRVSREHEVILIEPASPQVVYVPYYNPRVIYGNWWWPAYQPYYWTPPGGLHLGAGFYWGSGIRVSPGFFYSTVHWPLRHVVIVQHYRPFHLHGYRSHRDYYASFDRSHRWRHDARHRRGVIYGDRDWQRRPARPPQQIGRPPQRTQPVQRESVLRGTHGSRQSPSTVQRGVERRTQERQTGPRAHQFGQPGAPRDSADRRVPINPRAGEPRFQERQSIHRSAPVQNQQRGPVRSQQRSLQGGQSGGSSGQLGHPGNGGGGGGGASQDRRSMLR